jgi:branched-chain amino acid transport system permease protein
MSEQWTIRTGSGISRIFSVVAVAGSVVLALLPFFAGRGTIQDLFHIMTLLVLAQCWNMLAGYAGLVSVGQQAYVGLGAYVFYILAIFMPVPPLIGLVAGGVAAAAVAAVAATFTFRLNGAYFAVGTWVVAEVVRLLLAQQSMLGGGSGMSLPPEIREALPGFALLREAGFAKSFAIDIIAYWAALLLCGGTIFVIFRFLKTPNGLGLGAVRDNQLAARSVGVDAARLKWLVYLGTAFLTGMAGALIFIQKQRVSPETGFSVLDWSAFVIFVVVIGGIGTIEGPIIGVLAFFLLQSFLAQLGPFYLIILGLLGIVTILAAPGGLWGLVVGRWGVALFPIRQRLVSSPK